MVKLFKGGIVKFVADRLRPIAIGVVKEISKIDKKSLRRGYEVESFSVTLKGRLQLPEVSVKFRKKKRRR